MVKRNIVKIDEEKCTGCGLCIPNCHEGALQIIDGKARLISDLFCDGLGNCLGHCPEDAITIEEREAEAYDERKVMDMIVKQGMNTVKAHLEHLKDHNETEFLMEAFDYLKEKGLEDPLDVSGKKETENDEIDNSDVGENKMGTKENKKEIGHKQCGCPGMAMKDFSGETGGCSTKAGNDDSDNEIGKRKSQLRQWPLQLHLVAPHAPYFQGKDVLLSADCVAFSVGDFHKDHLKGKSLAIACPKLDDGQDHYVDKLVALIDDSKINTLTVMIMEVPCCGGLLHIAKTAAEKASRKIPIKSIVVGIKGNVVSEEWV